MSQPGTDQHPDSSYSSESNSHMEHLMEDCLSQHGAWRNQHATDGTETNSSIENLSGVLSYTEPSIYWRGSNRPNRQQSQRSACGPHMIEDNEQDDEHHQFVHGSSESPWSTLNLRLDPGTGINGALSSPYTRRLPSISAICRADVPCQASRVASPSNEQIEDIDQKFSLSDVPHIHEQGASSNSNRAQGESSETSFSQGPEMRRREDEADEESQQRNFESEFLLGLSGEFGGQDPFYPVRDLQAGLQDYSYSNNAGSIESEYNVAVPLPNGTNGVSPQSATSDVDSRCGTCGVVFKGEYAKGNLARHMKLHGMSYPCEAQHCSRAFKRSDARLKHERRNHPELNRFPPRPRKPREGPDAVETSDLTQGQW